MYTALATLINKMSLSIDPTEKLVIIAPHLHASVVKLVDTLDSKSGSFAGVAVRVRPLVPCKTIKTSR